MKVLVLHNGSDIVGWMVGEDISTAEDHKPFYVTDNISVDDMTSQQLEVDSSEAYNPDLFTVIDNEVVKK